jgi:hypothetical protein
MSAPTPAPRKHVAPLVLAVTLLCCCVAAVAGVVGYSLHPRLADNNQPAVSTRQVSPTTQPPRVNAWLDIYRAKHSFVGTLGDKTMDIGTAYYTPPTRLMQFGPSDWFIIADTPVLTDINDAGPGAFTLKLSTEPKIDPYPYVSLSLTLPQQPGKYLDPSHVMDPRLPLFVGTAPAFVPLAQLNPGPGRRLNDYIADSGRHVSSLKSGESGYVFLGFTLRVADSPVAYVMDATYGTSSGTSSVKITQISPDVLAICLNTIKQGFGMPQATLPYIPVQGTLRAVIKPSC